MFGRIRAMMAPRFGDCASGGRRISSIVAATAPQSEWPSTTINRVPRLAAANSALPISDGATILPATRITNRSPRFWSNTISTGTLESEQPSTTAIGLCPSTRARLAEGSGGALKCPVCRT
jgi:hypothetical protein